jgi:hypothetical protein
MNLQDKDPRNEQCLTPTPKTDVFRRLPAIDQPQAFTAISMAEVIIEMGIEVARLRAEAAGTVHLGNNRLSEAEYEYAKIYNQLNEKTTILRHQIVQTQELEKKFQDMVQQKVELINRLNAQSDAMREKESAIALYQMKVERLEQKIKDAKFAKKKRT